MAEGADETDPNAPTAAVSASKPAIDALAGTAATGPEPTEGAVETDPMVDHRVPTNALFQWGNLYALEQLGAGGFGQVYRAYDPVLDREVALKLHHANDRSAAYLAEARSLARVRHANVLAVHGADVHDGRAGIWMDLIDGRDFESVVRTDGPLSAAESTRVGIELCQALAAVHGASMVHGDIKTHNVMRARGGHIVLMDFGTVSPLHGDSGPNAGTLVAMAPELLRGEAPSVRSDIYALGVLLYRLASGHWPYDDLSSAKLARGETPRVPLRDRRADLPPAFVEVVERAMAPDAALRPASAGAMERALMALPGGPKAPAPADPQPPAAPPPGPPPTAPRPKWPLIAGVAALLLGALVWFWSGEEAAVAPDHIADDLADAAPPDAALILASATADIAETDDIDRSVFQVWRTPGGALLLAPPHPGRGPRPPSYVAEGPRFYRQIETGSSRMSPTHWSYVFWDPRVPVNFAAQYIYRDGEARVECGTKTLPLTRIEGPAAAETIAKATLQKPRWRRRPWLLARAADSTWYYVDREATRERQGFRLFIGPTGALRERPLTVATVGANGAVFVAATGELRQGPLPSFMGSTYEPGAPDEIDWITRDGARERLSALPTENNAALIYGELQIYDSTRLGTPCDEVFAPAGP